MNGAAIKLDLAAGAILTAGLGMWLAPPWQGDAWPLAAALVAYALPAAILAWFCTTRRVTNLGIGWANRVTLLRAAIVCALAGALLEPALFVERAWTICSLVIVALALDGIDGWIARRLDEISKFGARFDMETDAALILVLCCGLYLSGLAPIWVLAIGLMRPAFVLAGYALPWLSRPLPERFRRKVVCVIQVGALPVALLPLGPDALRLTVLAAALLALAVSFTIDMAWLFHHRRASDHPQWRTP